MRLYNLDPNHYYLYPGGQYIFAFYAKFVIPVDLRLAFGRWTTFAGRTCDPGSFSIEADFTVI